MGLTAALLHNMELVAAGTSTLVYVGLLLAFGTFKDPDIQRVLRVVPFIGKRYRPVATGD